MFHKYYYSKHEICSYDQLRIQSHLKRHRQLMVTVKWTWGDPCQLEVLSYSSYWKCHLKQNPSTTGQSEKVSSSASSYLEKGRNTYIPHNISPECAIALHFGLYRPLTYYFAVVPATIADHPYPAVVKRQPAPAEGDSEANNRSNPMPGSAMWPPIGITMQYVLSMISLDV